GSSAISFTSSACTTLLSLSSTMHARAHSPASGPVVISTPYCFAKSVWRIEVDSVCTFLSPSAPQKRLNANGRSAAMQVTTASFTPLIFSLNLRVDVAQVGVSTDG